VEHATGIPNGRKQLLSSTAQFWTDASQSDIQAIRSEDLETDNSVYCKDLDDEERVCVIQKHSAENYGANFDGRPRYKARITEDGLVYSIKNGNHKYWSLIQGNFDGFDVQEIKDLEEEIIIQLRRN
jgi:hypothetical protein